MTKSSWVACPKCGYAHFIKRYRNTVLLNFPAYCKGCKSEVNISIRAKEPKYESVV
ncbi:MAG: conjugal transfer protein [Lachnospiraceae bacterium]|nr:conjugal transfer protein [Lachnospiraceae bacterium]